MRVKCFFGLSGRKKLRKRQSVIEFYAVEEALRK
jgi:hypothetical protein